MTDFLKIEDDIKNEVVNTNKYWKVLIIDDDEDVHTITKMVLKDLKFENKKLKFLDAYSNAEARKILLDNDDIAVALIDVVMEKENSGLELIKFIRETLKNKYIRLLIRTGQPGEAPEERIIQEYDINDYKEKTELTSKKLYTTMIASIRAYKDIMDINYNKIGFENIINSTKLIFEENKINDFIKVVFKEMNKILCIKDKNCFKDNNGFSAIRLDNNYILIEVIGEFKSYLGKPYTFIEDKKVIEVFENMKKNLYIYENKIFFKLNYEYRDSFVFYIEYCFPLKEIDKKFIEMYYSEVVALFNNLNLVLEIEETQKEIIYTLGEVVEGRSNETGYHVRRVAEYSKILALGCGLSEEEANKIKMAAPMHDVGKVAIPDKILLKPGKLNEEEFKIMKTHAQLGYELLKKSKRNILQISATIAHEHHERWDGSGYPLGLKGEEISIYGRIVSIVDVFDALISDRVYRKAMDLETAKKIIRDGSGKNFDPKLVEIFFNNFDKILKIKGSFKD
ncbi:phosphodiesterase [Tepiditoga spiralis]|uniref:Phosphodiesterase n=1 Tax=Tepiditoga spiralis TaxID=2108365 RepID=A0A7G1G778_9BACT|nr:HD domain-containing phosphohydrolase [Tepiditoga spiralis]BBE31196.1 phosphodiesterase [Tepiditoga spiralis]